MSDDRIVAVVAVLCLAVALWHMRPRPDTNPLRALGRVHHRINQESR
jgi:hypothetical protein